MARPTIGEPGTRRYITTVSLTREQQILIRKFGGSKWLREVIEAEKKQREKNATTVQICEQIRYTACT